MGISRTARHQSIIWKRKKIPPTREQLTLCERFSGISVYNYDLRRMYLIISTMSKFVRRSNVIYLREIDTCICFEIECYQAVAKLLSNENYFAIKMYIILLFCTFILGEINGKEIMHTRRMSPRKQKINSLLQIRLVIYIRLQLYKQKYKFLQREQHRLVAVHVERH